MPRSGFKTFLNHQAHEEHEGGLSPGIFVSFVRFVVYETVFRQVQTLAS
jgi:hypothetical protein